MPDLEVDAAGKDRAQECSGRRPRGRARRAASVRLHAPREADLERGASWRPSQGFGAPAPQGAPVRVDRTRPFADHAHGRTGAVQGCSQERKQSQSAPSATRREDVASRWVLGEEQGRGRPSRRPDRRDEEQGLPGRRSRSTRPSRRERRCSAPRRGLRGPGRLPCDLARVSPMFRVGPSGTGAGADLLLQAAGRLPCDPARVSPMFRVGPSAFRARARARARARVSWSRRPAGAGVWKCHMPAHSHPRTGRGPPPLPASSP